MHNVRKVKTTEDKRREKLELSKKNACQYIQLQDNFLVMREKQDFSVESLKLTTTMLNMSADSYSIWNFRKKILINLDVTSPETKSSRDKEELKWLEGVLAMHHKSYWAWFHRKWLTARIPDMDWTRELNLCTRALDMDQRNFHCWDYRRFVATQSKIPFRAELDYTMSKIEQNFSNYSAWQQRSILMQKIYDDNPGGFVQVLNEELELVQNAFYTSPDDQSAWFYHRWLIGMQKKHNSQNFQSVVSQELSKVQELLKEEPNSKWAMLTVVFLMIEMGADSTLVKEKLEKLSEVDPFHKNYYKSLLQKYNN